MKVIKLGICGSLVLIGALIRFANAADNKNYERKAICLSDSSQLKMSAKDSSVIDETRKLVKLYGDASISEGSSKITAEYIEFNEDTRMGVARGNVVIYSYNKIIIKNPIASFFKLEYPPNNSVKEEQSPAGFQHPH